MWIFLFTFAADSWLEDVHDVGSLLTPLLHPRNSQILRTQNQSIPHYFYQQGKILFHASKTVAFLFKRQKPATFDCLPNLW